MADLTSALSNGLNVITENHIWVDIEKRCKWNKVTKIYVGDQLEIPEKEFFICANQVMKDKKKSDTSNRIKRYEIE